MLHVGLNLSVGELASDQALCVEDSVGRVHCDLVLRRVTDQTFCVGEGNERWGGSVALVVGNDFNTVIAEDTHARVRGTQVDTDSRGHGCGCCSVRVSCSSRMKAKSENCCGM